MILVALGANLPSEAGEPAQTLRAAMDALDAAGLRVARRSRIFESPPWPPSDQPWYANAVVQLDTRLAPAALLDRLHAIERAFGRVRTVPNAARALDLDLLDYDGIVNPGPAPILPHPRMRERAFVLLPLADVAPDWHHPADGTGIATLVAALPDGTVCRPLPNSPASS
ncbi:MAG: 2-amino-4-hydroxy-6-hydroxymethyldihydropteridine diphosphokinase [Alphaproteobacteria bacterium]|nr:2-amino-4-hydroxy-6-hydroxymethyldihydropteridine diphosphokinase [Alphaproteobacteria bacterium]